MNVVVVVIDRLHAEMLGFAGNPEVASPAWNRLAAESLVGDQAYLDATSLADLYRAWWQGHATAGGGVQACGPPLAELARRGGVNSLLVTDDPLSDVPWLNDTLDERIECRRPTTLGMAESWEATHAADLFATASEALAARQGPFFAWIHFGGLGTTWDAPAETRALYHDDEDPFQPDLLEPPRVALPPRFDPDEISRFTQSYSAQLTVLDQALGSFLTALDESPAGVGTWLVVLGGRGLALGAQRRLGVWDEALCGDTVHTPWLCRAPDRRGALCRTSALLLPADLYATLAELWCVDSGLVSSWRRQSWLPLLNDEPLTGRDRVLMVGPTGERALRAGRWFWRRAGSAPLAGDEPLPNAAEEERRAWLYVKPDDAWEVNDVARRCPSIVEALERAAQEAEQAGDVAALPPLDPQLNEPPR